MTTAPRPTPFKPLHDRNKGHAHHLQQVERYQDVIGPHQVAEREAMVRPHGADDYEREGERNIARPLLDHQVLETHRSVGIVQPRDADREHQQSDRKSEDAIAERPDPRTSRCCCPDASASGDSNRSFETQRGTSLIVVDRASGVSTLLRTLPAYRRYLVR